MDAGAGAGADALVEPYRAENARMVRDNNDLHQQLLRLKEEKDRVTRGKRSSPSTPRGHGALIASSPPPAELKGHIRKVDHENSDLKFLNNQYVHKVRCLEKDGKAKSERIQQLQAKNMQAVVQTPGEGRRRARVMAHELF